MPLYNGSGAGIPGPVGPPGPAGSDTGIYVNAGGWLIVPGQLPTKTLKDTFIDGNGVTRSRIIRTALDGTTERETISDF